MAEMNIGEIVNYECLVTGQRHVAVDNDVDDPADDIHLPPGWCRVTVESVTQNPDASPNLPAERQAWVNQQMQMVPADQRDTPEGQIALQALQEQAEERYPDLPLHIVQRVTFYVSAESAKEKLCLDSALNPFFGVTGE